MQVYTKPNIATHSGFVHQLFLFTTNDKHNQKKKKTIIKTQDKADHRREASVAWQPSSRWGPRERAGSHRSAASDQPAARSEGEGPAAVFYAAERQTGWSEQTTGHLHHHPQQQHAATNGYLTCLITLNTRQKVSK